MTAKELEKRQHWRLDHKIDHALGVIDQFLSRIDAYVSFSGGKDSTVLLDLCRMVKPDIKAVFCNTGNEFPEIVQFVRDLKIGGGKHRHHISRVQAKTNHRRLWLSVNFERHELQIVVYP